MQNVDFIKKLNDLFQESGEFQNILVTYGWIDETGFHASDRDLKRQDDPREMVRIKNCHDGHDMGATFISVNMDNHVGVLYDIVGGLKEHL